jgi:hypothetical protein
LGRTDRVLIAIALLFLLLTAGSFFGVDEWLFPESREGGEAIAELVSGEGDVRVKFFDQFQWQRGKVSQKLVYDDAVFSGESSSAQLRIGESKLGLSANTLIILRQEKAFKTINLTRGILEGMLAKNDQLIIETGDGERFQLQAVENSQIKIERKGSKTSFKVTQGNATLVNNGQAQTLTSRDAQEFADRTPRKSEVLQFSAPGRSWIYTRESLAQVEFAWEYVSGRKPKSGDEFILEFAEEATFKRIVLRENLLGRMAFQAGLPLPQTLYYRVRDARGNSSSILKLNLDRPAIPVVLAPKAGEEFEAARGDTAPVMIAIQSVPAEGQVQIQVSATANFSEMGVDTLTTVPQAQFSFQPGDYFVRARNQVENGKLASDWSQAVAFHVREGVDRLHLRRAALKTHIVIPNLNYTPQLYSRDDSHVQKHLAGMAPFPGFFQDLNYQNHTLLGRREGRGGEVNITEGHFPPEWIEPGLADIHLRLDGAGKIAPVAHRMVIEMEAPKNLDATSVGKLSWSPILFARGYEGRLTSSTGSESFASNRPGHIVAVVPGTRYSYQVRALGRRGVPISGWSAAHEFEAPYVPPPPVEQAPVVEQTPLAAQERKPAEAKDNPASLRVKKEQPDRSLWERIGWWLWAGSGYNYVNVRQTINNTADVEYKNTKGPSGYIEAGYLSSRRVGGIFSYKRTPGEVRIDNYPVNDRDFVWTTTSLEGLWVIPWYVRLFDHPLLWSLRAGVQNHYFPFLYVETGSRLIQGTNNMMTATLGFLTETVGNKIKYYWSMRYQQPVSSSSEGGNSFTVTPTMAFDGSVGASYNFTERWKTGLFWYGQFHQYDFKYQSSTQTNSGKQSLFFSNMEFRLGVDF